MKQSFSLFKLCNIIKSDIRTEIDNIPFKHFDKVGIGSLSIWVPIKQKGRFTILLFHRFCGGLWDRFIDIEVFTGTTLRLVCYFGFALILFELKLWRIPYIRVFVEDFFGHHVIIGFWCVHAVVSGGGSEIGFGLIEIFTRLKIFELIIGKRIRVID